MKRGPCFTCCVLVSSLDCEFTFLMCVFMGCVFSFYLSCTCELLVYDHKKSASVGEQHSRSLSGRLLYLALFPACVNSQPPWGHAHLAHIFQIQILYFWPNKVYILKGRAVIMTSSAMQVESRVYKHVNPSLSRKRLHAWGGGVTWRVW